MNNYTMRGEASTSLIETQLPEFVVTFRENPIPQPIPFESIYNRKDDLTSMALLWDTSCYYVNLDKRYFIINGGRRISISNSFKNTEELRILYFKRNTANLETFGNGGFKDHEVSYLLGFQGEDNELMIHISPDGRYWYWKDKR